MIRKIDCKHIVFMTVWYNFSLSETQYLDPKHIAGMK